MSNRAERRRIERGIEPGSVCVSWISPGEVRHEFAISLVHSLQTPTGRDHITHSVAVKSGPRVAEGRNQLVDGFARTRAEWLWMVDSDMSWEAETFERAYAMLDPEQLPILGGLCFGGYEGHQQFPTIYRLRPTPSGWPETDVVNNFPDDTLIKAGATGAAWLFIHRNVLTTMQQKFKTLPNGEPDPYVWFVEASNGGKPYGEDIAFCLRAQAAGFPVHVHTGLEINHWKARPLNRSTYQHPAAATMNR